MRCPIATFRAYPPPPAFYLSQHASPIINAAKLQSAKLTICSEDKSLSLTGRSGPQLCFQMLDTLDSTYRRGGGLPSHWSLSRPWAPTSGPHREGSSSRPKSKAQGLQGPLTTSAPPGKAPAIFETKYFLEPEKVHISKSTGTASRPFLWLSLPVIFSSSFLHTGHGERGSKRVPRATL